MDKGKINVLIIDDKVEYAEILKEIIEKDGYKAFTANNGISGLEFINSMGIDKLNFIILDITMPDMDGFEFFAKYNKKYEEKYTSMIQVLTADANPIVDNALKKMGKKIPILQKPVSPEMLLTRIKCFARIPEIELNCERILKTLYRFGISDFSKKDNRYIKYSINYIIDNNIYLDKVKMRDIYIAVAELENKDNPTEKETTPSAVEKGARTKAKEVNQNYTFKDLLQEILITLKK